MSCAPVWMQARASGACASSRQHYATILAKGHAEFARALAIRPVQPGQFRVVDCLGPPLTALCRSPLLCPAACTALRAGHQEGLVPPPSGLAVRVVCPGHLGHLSSPRSIVRLASDPVCGSAAH